MCLSEEWLYTLFTDVWRHITFWMELTCQPRWHDDLHWNLVICASHKKRNPTLIITCWKYIVVLHVYTICRTIKVAGKLETMYITMTHRNGDRNEMKGYRPVLHALWYFSLPEWETVGLFSFKWDTSRLNDAQHSPERKLMSVEWKY